MNDEAKRDLRNVLVMALADGRLTDAEKQFVHRLRERLGVSKDDLRQLIEQFKAHPKRITISPGPAGERTIQLMASMAAADGRISEREQRILDKLAEKAGLKRKKEAPKPAATKPAAATAAPPAPTPDSIEADPADARKVAALTEEVYRSFNGWDPATRRQKLDELATLGTASLEGLLRIMESYRVPDKMPNALELKTLAAERLGGLNDSRAVYYLAQQVVLGEGDDDLSNPQLRAASAEALGKLVGQDFTRDQAGVEAARQWWLSQGSKQYSSLAI